MCNSHQLHASKYIVYWVGKHFQDGGGGQAVNSEVTIDECTIAHAQNLYNLGMQLDLLRKFICMEKHVYSTLCMNTFYDCMLSINVIELILLPLFAAYDLLKHVCTLYIFHIMSGVCFATYIHSLPRLHASEQFTDFLFRKYTLTSYFLCACMHVILYIMHALLLKIIKLTIF